MELFTVRDLAGYMVPPGLAMRSSNIKYWNWSDIDCRH